MLHCIRLQWCCDGCWRWHHFLQVQVSWCRGSAAAVDQTLRLRAQQLWNAGTRRVQVLQDCTEKSECPIPDASIGTNYCHKYHFGPDTKHWYLCQFLTLLSIQKSTPISGPKPTLMLVLIPTLVLVYVPIPVTNTVWVLITDTGICTDTWHCHWYWHLTLVSLFMPDTGVSTDTQHWYQCILGDE